MFSSNTGEGTRTLAYMHHAPEKAHVKSVPKIDIFSLNG